MAVAIAKVTYTDKHTDEAGLTPRVITSCEEHAQKEGWAPGEASEMRRSYSLASLACRYAGKTTLPYPQWLDQIETIEVTQPGDSGNPTA